MTSKRPGPSKDERLAKALRENLARRKALVRAKRQRAGSEQQAVEVSDQTSDHDEPLS